MKSLKADVATVLGLEGTDFSALEPAGERYYVLALPDHLQRRLARHTFPFPVCHRSKHGKI